MNALTKYWFVSNKFKIIYQLLMINKKKLQYKNKEGLRDLAQLEKSKLEYKIYSEHMKNSIFQHEIDSLYSCQCLKCVSYLQHDRKWFFYLTIVLFLNKQKDKHAQLENILCSLVREQKYVLVIALQIVEEKYIKGFKEISENLNKQVTLRIDQALKKISGGKIYATLDIIQFKNQFFSAKSSMAEYGIKVHLRVDNSQLVPFFYPIGSQSKTSHSKLWKDKYHCKQIPIEGQDIYLKAIQQILGLMKRKRRSNIVQHWEVNKNIDLPQNQIQSRLKIISSHQKYFSNKYQFSKQPDSYFKKICIIFYQSKFQTFFRSNFYQSTIFVFIDESQGVIQVLRKFQKLFDSLKIKYRLIIPFSDFQEQNIAFRREHELSNNFFYVVAYTFSAPYSKFIQLYNEKLGKQLNIVVKVDEVRNQLETQEKMTMFQIELYNRVIVDKYSESQKIIKQNYSNSKSIEQQRIRLTFQKQDISIYSFLLFYFGLKKPVFCSPKIYA